MQVQRTVDTIEYATNCRWWILTGLLLVSSPWPVLVVIEAATIAWAVWSRGGDA